MKKLDAYEDEVLSAYETGKLKSVATKSELAKFKAAARSTAVKDKRVNIRLSSGDLCLILIDQVEAALAYIQGKVSHSQQAALIK